MNRARCDAVPWKAARNKQRSAIGLPGEPLAAGDDTFNEERVAQGEFGSQPSVGTQ